MSTQQFTLEDFLAFLEAKGAPPRVISTIRRFPEDVTPYLARIQQRLIEKGLLTAPPRLTPAEERALPYLRRLDRALKEGGDAGARAELVALAGDATARQALVALAQA